MSFSYFVNKDTVEKYSYIVVPKALLKGDAFKGMSADTKLAYVLFLDRLSLSKKNNWIDEEGRFYIIYSVEEIMNDLEISNKTVSKILQTLEEKYGLIERVKRGLGLTNLIYVKDFANKIDDIENTTNSLKCKNFTSKNTEEKNLQCEVKKMQCPAVKKMHLRSENFKPLMNKPYKNNTYKNNISSSFMINDYNNYNISNIDVEDDDDDKIDKINLFSYFNFSNFSTKEQERTKNIIQLLEEIMSEDKSKAIEISNFDGYRYSDVQNHILKFKKTDLLNISKKLSSYKKPISNLKAFLISLLLNNSATFPNNNFKNSGNCQKKEIINTKVHMMDTDEFLKE